jgi:hypothetical protein
VPEAGRVSRKPFLVREIGRHLFYDSVTVRWMKKCDGLHLSDTLHETVAEERAIRGTDKETALQHTRYTLTPALCQS